MGLFTKDQEFVCPGCGSKIQSTDRFCKYCGRPVAQGAPTSTPSAKPGMRQCTGCGREFPEGLNFCPYCGRPAAGSTAAVPGQAAAAPAPIPASMPAPTAPAPPPEPTVSAPKPTSKCVSCGREILEGLKFCPYCARPNPYAPSAPVSMPQPAPPVAPPATPARTSSGMERCNACGKEIPSGLKYCPYCGRLAAAEQPVPQPAQMPQSVSAPMPPAIAPTSAPIPAPPATTKKCAGCGREINIGMKFCPYCGTAGTLPQQAPPAQPAGTRICPGCGKEISITHEFCPSCGYPKNPRFY
jgi:rRNA maturation endonuclease Nob1